MWNDWSKSHPTPGNYVYARDLDAINIWELGWAVGEEGNTKVVLEQDPLMGKYLYDEWQSVPLPTDNWKKNLLDPGKYVYVRNCGVNDQWEVGLSVVDKGSVKVVLIKDPGMKKQTFDEWQPVSPPVDKN